MSTELKDGDAVKAALESECDQLDTSIAEYSMQQTPVPQGDPLTNIREWGCTSSQKTGANPYAMVSSWDSGEPQAAKYLSRVAASAELYKGEAGPSDGYCYVANSKNNWVATFFSADEHEMPSVITGSDGSVVEGACGSFEQ